MENSKTDFNKLKFMPIESIRQLYREYLIEQNLSNNTIQTSCSDAFYLMRNDRSLDFWVMIESPNCEEIAYEHLKNILSQKSHGNVNANISTYMAQIRRFKQFAIGDPEVFKATSQFRESSVSQRRSIKQWRADLATPSVEEVRKYLSIWDKLESYLLQEDALNKLFLELCPDNKDISDILIKASTLNDFYSTSIFSIFPVAKHIFDLGIDKRLRLGDESLINDMQYVTINGRTLNLYSFATKYCSHHNSKDYPIYDSYVNKVLRYFRNFDRFSNFESADLKNYVKFKNILIQFRTFYGLDQYDLKEIDKYLWQLGKEYFPNNYGKKKSKQD